MHLSSIFVVLKGVMKTKYKFGSLKRLLCFDNNDTNFIVSLEQINKILKKTDEAVVAPQPLSSHFSMMSQNLVCGH